MTDLSNEYDDDLYGLTEQASYEDADAFFAAEVQPAASAVLRLYGREYPLPARLPLAFMLLLERHADDSSLEALRAVLAPVFGTDALDYWIERGIDDRQLGIVLAWSAANMRQPGSLTFAEAARAFDEGGAQGKAPEPTTPNRAARRARTRSGRRS